MAKAHPCPAASTRFCIAAKREVLIALSIGREAVPRPRDHSTRGAVTSRWITTPVPLSMSHKHTLALPRVPLRAKARPWTRTSFARTCLGKARPGLAQWPSSIPSIRVPRACCGRVTSASASSPQGQSDQGCRFGRPWTASRSPAGRSRTRSDGSVFVSAAVCAWSGTVLVSAVAGPQSGTPLSGDSDRAPRADHRDRPPGSTSGNSICIRLNTMGASAFNWPIAV
jgi:hypothetical protein